MHVAASCAPALLCFLLLNCALRLDPALQELPFQHDHAQGVPSAGRRLHRGAQALGANAAHRHGFCFPSLQHAACEWACCGSCCGGMGSGVRRPRRLIASCSCSVAALPRSSFNPLACSMPAAFALVELADRAGVPPGALNVLSGSAQPISDALMASEVVSGTVAPT